MANPPQVNTPPQQLTGIPKSNVGQVVQSFIDNDDARKVTATAENPARTTWKVKAEF